MIISGRLLWGFKPQIYRCYCQILYLLTFFKVLPQKQKRWVNDQKASNLRPKCSYSRVEENIWVNWHGDSNLRLGNIGINALPVGLRRNMGLPLQDITRKRCEIIISGRLSWGLKPRIYRCCSLIIYLLTFTNLVQLLFLYHTKNCMLFASWVGHQKVFQMQVLRSVI